MNREASSAASQATPRAEASMIPMGEAPSERV
jgi:hypothetical protein